MYRVLVNNALNLLSAPDGSRADVVEKSSSSRHRSVDARAESNVSAVRPR